MKLRFTRHGADAGNFREENCMDFMPLERSAENMIYELKEFLLTIVNTQPPDKGNLQEK